MRAYTVATAAVTLGVSSKWLDNVLSHHSVEGVVQTRQGVSRNLSPRAVASLYIALDMVRGLSVPLRRALAIAGRLAAIEGSATVALSRHTNITVDTTAAATHISARLASAVEVTPIPQRGRPAK